MYCNIIYYVDIDIDDIVDYMYLYIVVKCSQICPKKTSQKSHTQRVQLSTPKCHIAKVVLATRV